MPEAIISRNRQEGSLSQPGSTDATIVQPTAQKNSLLNSILARLKKLRTYHSSFFSRLLDYITFRKMAALAIFTRELATLYRAGLPLDMALLSLAEQTELPGFRPVIYEVTRKIREGYTLSRAFSKHPDYFSRVYTAMVATGEISGALDKVLERLADLLEKEYRTAQQVRTSLTYPLFIFASVIICSFVMVNYLFPLFMEPIYAANVSFSIFTRTLILVTECTSNPLVIASGILVLLLVLVNISLALRQERQRLQIHRMLLQVPYVGSILKKAAITRFCYTLSLMLECGVPLVKAVGIVGTSSGNEVFKDASRAMVKKMKEGQAFSQLITGLPLFPSMMQQAVVVGEDTGKLPLMLKKLADYFDMDLSYALEIFLNLLEPMAIIFMGVLVGFVLLAVFGPIMQMLRLQ